MRILIVHNKYQCRGGEEVVVESEGTLLSEYGHTVEYQIFDNAMIRTRLDRWRSVLGMLYNFRSAKALQSKIDWFRPDLIHVHNTHLLASPAVFYVAKRAHIPVVMTLHNFRLICPSGSLFFNNRIYERSLRSLFPLHSIICGVYRKSRMQTAAIAIVNCLHNLFGTWTHMIDRYIVMSEFAAQKFRQSCLRIPPGKFYVKPNFVTDCGMGNYPRDHFFLFAGRLNAEKGIEMLLRAAAKYNFPLVIIGDGPLKPLVHQYEKAHPNISYEGFLHKDLVLERLKKCTALIFPSICYEGFPLSILEAFSTGTPVIASRLGVLSHLIQDNVNGLLFEPGDEKDLFARITQVSGDTELTEKLGFNGRTAFITNYTREINYNALSDLYRQTLAASQSKSRKRKRSAGPVLEPAMREEYHGEVS